MALPFLPGYSFSETKKRHGMPQTLHYSKGVPLVRPQDPGVTSNPTEVLQAQNELLNDELLVELTYGPRRPTIQEAPLPHAIAFDKKVLRFSGYIREDVQECSRERYRIRPVKVYYYLQDDTMEVNEPRTTNSGLPQGLMIKRLKFPHPKGTGHYRWKDLNVGMDLFIYGKTIRLTDCDPWTQEYLTSAGIELNAPERIPVDEYVMEQIKMATKPKYVTPTVEEDKTYKFMVNDRKVLKFNGMWDDALGDPPDKRRVILQYYLADDTMELLEVHSLNDGRDPCRVLVRKQKVPIDRNKISERFPLIYLEIEENDLDEWFKPSDFCIGKEILLLGRKILLYDCDEFTRKYYKTHYGVDMMSFDIEPKPELKTPQITVSPHTGFGTWEDSLQSCFSLRPQPLRKDVPKSMYFADKMLRFSAHLDTPSELDKTRHFVITFYPSDDTATIFECAVPNSGFMSGTFLKRARIRKGQGPGDKPIYYQVKDFYIGAPIQASGRKFIINDADKFVLKFMEDNVDLYPEECVQIHRDRCAAQKAEQEKATYEKEQMMQDLRKEVTEAHGCDPYPIPQTLQIGTNAQPRDLVAQKLYSANLPISQKLQNKVLDICTDRTGMVDADEVKRILQPCLGHKGNQNCIP